jgi:uncharacterized protein with FMN-binding domain
MVTGMRRIALWILSTVAVVTLLFGYKTSLSGPSTPATSTVAVTAATPAAPSTGATVSGTTTTVTGSVAQTRWGPVQVTITVAGGKITAVDVPVYPNGNGKDAEINAYALPILTHATLTAQSANIDMISGATVTSDGYLQSLQSAIDQAHLA